MIDIYNKFTSRLDDIELVGSEKQIAWASQIRRKAAIYVHASYDYQDSYMKLFYRFLRGYTDASWWITNRENFRLIRQLYDEYREENGPVYDYLNMTEN